MDEFVGYGSEESLELKESFWPEEQEDGVARLIQAVKNCSEEPEDHDSAVQIAVEILQDHLDKPDLDPMLQTLIRKIQREELSKNKST